MKSSNATRDYDFWDKYPGIVWSNPDAGDSIMIYNALLRARQTVLAAIATHFGSERLVLEWKRLREDAKAFPVDLKAVISSGPKIEKIIADLSKDKTGV